MKELTLHISTLELKAAHLDLAFLRDLVMDESVVLTSDNFMVVAYIKKQGGTVS